MSVILAVLSISLFAAGPLLAQFGVLRPMHGFLLFALGSVLGLVILVLALVKMDLKLLVAGLVPVAILGFFLIRGRDLPRINDISSDYAAIPQFERAQSMPANQGRDFSYPPGFREQAEKAYPDLRPLVLEVPAPVAFQRSMDAVLALPNWSLTYSDGKRLHLEATVTTRLFRFQDDVVITIRPDGNRSVVSVRSKSRDGKGDFGKNAANIREFLGQLTQLSTP